MTADMASPWQPSRSRRFSNARNYLRGTTEWHRSESGARCSGVITAAAAGMIADLVMQMLKHHNIQIKQQKKEKKRERERE